MSIYASGSTCSGMELITLILTVRKPSMCAMWSLFQSEYCEGWLLPTISIMYRDSQ